MTTYHRQLGNEEVLIHAPRHGHFDRLLFERSLEDSLLGLDVETTALDEHLDQHHPDFRVRLIQFATTNEAWVLDMDDPEQRTAARRLLTDDDVRFASHTAMDVVTVYTLFGVDIAARNVDTHVLAAIAYPDRAGQGGLDLKTLTGELIGPELGDAQAELYQKFQALWRGKKGAAEKAVNGHGWGAVESDDAAYVTYAGMDAIAARRLVDILTAATNTPRRLIDVDTWIAGEFARRQAQGVRVDRAAAERLHAECRTAIAKPAELISDITGFRVTQDVRLREWLTANGVDPSNAARTEGKQLALGKNHLPALLDHDLTAQARHVVSAMITYREHQDALGQAEKIIKRLDVDERLHPQFRAVGAPTARMSCTGFNLQAVSKTDHRQRGLFRPDPGHTFVAIDYDQIELRLAAALAGEQAMYDTVLAGGDLHQLTADRIGVERSVAKAVNFMIVYGGGAAAVSAKTDLPKQVCARHVNAFKQAYPAIARLADHAAKSRRLVTGSGRHLALPGAKNGRSDRSYANVNYLIQSFARDLLAVSWYRFGVSLGHAQYVWLPIHDELVLHIPDDHLDKVSNAAEAAMNFEFRGMPFTAKAVPLIDENGVSRWMSADRAEEIAAIRAEDAA